MKITGVLTKILEIKKIYYYLALCFVSVLVAIVVNKILYTDELYYSTLGNQYTIEQIKLVLRWSKTWKLFGYFFIPIIVILRILYTTFCFQIGSLIQEKQWRFNDLFNISLKADVIFVISQICGFYYYLITGNYKTIEDLGINFLSLLNFINKNKIPDWLIFAFNSINIFELLYIIVLIILIMKYYNLSIFNSVIFVIFTYLVGNYFYIVVMTFLYIYIH